MGALSQVIVLESHTKWLVLPLLFLQSQLQCFVGLLTLFFYLGQLWRKPCLRPQASAFVVSGLIDPASGLFVELRLQGETFIFPVSISPCVAQMEAALELVTMLRTFHAIQIFIEIDVPETAIPLLLSCSFLALTLNSMLIYRQQWTLRFWYFLYRNLSLAVLQPHTGRYILPRVQLYTPLCQFQRDLIHRFLVRPHFIIENH